MAKRDIRVQYRQSLLGGFVILLPPLAMTAVALGFKGSGLLNVSAGTVPYGLYVLVGVVLWTTFLEAIFAPIYGLLEEQRLLALTTSPLEAILLGKIGPVLFNAAVKLLLLAVGVAWYGVALPTTVLLAPFGLLGLVALGTAMGLFFAPINLVYRDISKILMTVTTFWLFFSPVYFPPPASGIIGAIMRWNPVTPLISGTRALMLTGGIGSTRGVVLAALAFLPLVLCWVYARVALPIVIEQADG